jgi:hypothetical protein
MSGLAGLEARHQAAALEGKGPMEGIHRLPRLGLPQSAVAVAVALHQMAAMAVLAVGLAAQF